MPDGRDRGEPGAVRAARRVRRAARGDGPGVIREPRPVPTQPDTEHEGSPTVWLDREKREIVVQGLKADEVLEAEIQSQEWVQGHAVGIPAHEAVVRIPTRMVQILREACDAAERTGLC